MKKLKKEIKTLKKALKSYENNGLMGLYFKASKAVATAETKNTKGLGRAINTLLLQIYTEEIQKRKLNFKGFKSLETKTSKNKKAQK